MNEKKFTIESMHDTPPVHPVHDHTTRTTTENERPSAHPSRMGEYRRRHIHHFFFSRTHHDDVKQCTNHWWQEEEETGAVGWEWKEKEDIGV